MLAQHPWTGQLYDVPDYPNGLAGGYGFPPLAALIPAIGGLVGGLLRPQAPACQCGGRLSGVPDYPGLAGGYGFGPLGSLLSNVVSAIPGVGGLIGNLLSPGGSPAPPPPVAPPPLALPAPPMPPLPMTGFPLPPLPGLPFPPLPPLPGLPIPGAVPPGFTQPLPGATLPGQRMYLRCSMWPGPPGLVPTTPVTVVPPAPGVPFPAPLIPGGGGFRRRSRRRR
jgi:hypothetical protein